MLFQKQDKYAIIGGKKTEKEGKGMCVDERKGKHLTFVERLTIERMERNNFSKKDIATAIGCCRTTIYNELRRSTYVHTNTDLTEEIRYNPSGAQSRYEELLQKKGRYYELYMTQFAGNTI